MSYTIRSARYANAERTSAVADTVEAAHVLLSAADTPAEWATLMARVASAELAIADYVAPAAQSRRIAVEKLAALLVAKGLTPAELDALLA